MNLSTQFHQNKRSILFYFFYVLLAIGCTKSPPLQSDFSILDGRIVFKDPSAFERTMRNLFESKNLDGFEKTLGSNFYSMRTAYDNLANEISDIDAFVRQHKQVLSLITGTDGELEIERNIDDEQLATLVSDNGLLQIGQVLYRFSYNYVFKTSVTPNLDIDDFLNTDENTLVYEVIPIVRTTSLRSEVDNCIYEYQSGPRRRLKGELWINQIGGIYSGAGARTKHQQFFWPAWWRSATCKIRLDVSGTYKYTSGGITYGPYNINYSSGWLTDDGRDAYTFDFCVNQSCTFLSNVDGFHGCRYPKPKPEPSCNDVSEITCTTSHN
jgi:hypothetical protein